MGTLSLEPKHLAEGMRPHHARVLYGTSLVVSAQGTFALFSDKRCHHGPRGPMVTLLLLRHGSRWTLGSLPYCRCVFTNR